MKNELIVFTHNDLDAAGCSIIIETKLPNIKKKYFYTNYGNLSDVTDEIIQYIQKNKNTHILIPDVSFGDNKEALRKLNAVAKVTCIDHHLYPDGFWEEFPDIRVIHDVEKSATMLCLEHFNMKGYSERLDKLCEFIDVYDIWKVNDRLFDTAQDLNDYFWECDLEWFRDEVLRRDFRLPENFKEVLQDIKNEQAKCISEYENKKLIQRIPGVTLCFFNLHFNKVLVQEMKKGQDIVIGLSTYGIIKVRISESASYTIEQKNNLRSALTGTSSTGHENCFTYKLEDATLETIMNEAQKIMEKIEENMNEL